MKSKKQKQFQHLTSRVIALHFIADYSIIQDLVDE